jgi:hypothetical protein
VEKDSNIFSCFLPADGDRIRKRALAAEQRNTTLLPITGGNADAAGEGLQGRGSSQWIESLTLPRFFHHESNQEVCGEGEHSDDVERTKAEHVEQERVGAWDGKEDEEVARGARGWRGSA